MNITTRLLALLILISHVPLASAQEFQAGVGRADITPTEPIRLAGYGGRNRPHESIDQPIFTKALALQDSTGALTVIVTADTIGVPRAFNDELAARLERELKVPRERFLFANSHSHSTPVIHGALINHHVLDEKDAATVERYTKFFLQKSSEAAQAAVKDFAAREAGVWPQRGLLCCQPPDV